MVLRDYLCLGLQSHFQWTSGDYLWYPRYEPELQPLKSHVRYMLSLLYYLSCPSIVYLWFWCYIQRCSGFTTSSACDMGNRNQGSSFSSPISQSSPLVRVVDCKQVPLFPTRALCPFGNVWKHFFCCHNCMDAAVHLESRDRDEVKQSSNNPEISLFLLCVSPFPP